MKMVESVCLYLAPSDFSPAEVTSPCVPDPLLIGVETFLRMPLKVSLFLACLGKC